MCKVGVDLDSFGDLKEDITLHKNYRWEMRMEIADDPYSHRLTLVKIDPSWIQLQSGTRINIFHNAFKKKSVD